MPNLNDEYRSLLTAGESIATLDAVIDLLLRIADGTASRSSTRKSSSSTERWVRIPSVSTEFAAIFFRKPAEQRGQGRASSGFAARAAKAAWLLDSVPPRMQEQEGIPSGQYSLIMDLLLLLFHQAYFVLLPKMHGENSHRQRSALLAAFHHFAEQLPRDADRFQVLGLVYEAEGNMTEAANCYRKAMNATHADEHDFVTRAQMLWTHLHDMGDLSGAGRLLLDIYPRVQRKDLDEVSEMIWDTMQALDHRGAGATAV